MTNYEFYKDKIKAITDLGITFAVNVNNNEVTLCDCITCGDCLFNPDCDESKYKWAYQEHEEQVNWSEVPVNTKIYVKNVCDDIWQPRHFARYKDGKIYAWQGCGTSFTTPHDEVTYWGCAKLAEK